MSFYGRSELALPRGINLILGPGGSGKTNLWNAISFAVSGRPPGRFDPLNKLINHKHREETSTPSCSAEVEFSYEGKRLSAACSLKVDEGEIVQSRRESLTIDDFEIPCWNCLYVDPENMLDMLNQEHKNWSSGQRWEHVIMRDLVRNTESGIKSAIIDGSFERLGRDSREKVFNLIDELKLEQLIIMSWRLPDNIERYQYTIHHIEYDPKNLSSRIVERKETTAG